nr:MAG TPA: hypothetical protein [Bacteriophage sp.]
MDCQYWIRDGAYTSVRQTPDKCCNVGSIPTPSTMYGYLV